MSHFYVCESEFSARLIETVGTFAQARKHRKDLVKSITTVLHYLPSSPCKTPDGFGYWLEWSMWKLGTEGHSFEEAQRRKYKMRTCPETGELITSSEFGTRAHAALEKLNIGLITGAMPAQCEFYAWVNLWADWLGWGTTSDPISAEYMMADRQRKLAGTIDFIGEDEQGVFIADYKFRDGDLKTKAREKDCMQLAWAADRVKAWRGLSYNPRIFSVIFDSEKPDMHVKQWTPAAQKKALKRLEIVNEFVNKWECL